MKILNFRLIIFSISLLFGLVFSLSSFGVDVFKTPKISLGLDLQGGLNLLLGVDTKEAIKTKLNSIATSLSHDTKTKEILIEDLNIDTNTNSISFALLDSEEKSNIEKILSDFGGVQYVENNLNYSLTMPEDEIAKIKANAINQAILTIRNRIDLFGLAEPSVSRQGRADILVQLPGIKTAEQEKRAINLIMKSAHLQMMAVDEDRQARAASLGELEAKKYNDIVLSEVNNPNIKFVLKSIPIIDGNMLTDASVGYDKNNQPVVNFSLDSQGAKIFGDFSANNIGKRMAIVLDNKVYSAPYIRERIGGGSGQISGNFNVEEASDLAIALRSGALPAPMYILEKRSVGPSLGADSIKASFVAFVSGFSLVLLFMIAYYHVAGVIATIALFVNVLLIVATMALFGATLTLPGMAGIVLIVGMSIDANIIINERIREGLREGLSVKESITLGYNAASRAIFDANLTSLIVAILLYVYGTGAIKGFAITTSIGILASIITAIIGTHGIYEALLSRVDIRSYRLWFGLSNRYKNPANKVAK